MRKWIKTIQLEFSIGTLSHTVLLDFSSSQLFTTVFDRRLSVFPRAEVVASFKSREAYAGFLQELFFDQLGYYPLRKVQANQSSVGLMDADFSWATYYSSIYLQSKD